MTTKNNNPNVADEEPYFTQNSLSSPIVFVSVNNKYYFPPMNDSDSFGTVDYHAPINIKADFSINHVY